MKDYYNGSACLELIDIFLNKLNLEGSLAFYSGNIIKYIYRYDNKEKEKDLDKAIDYINLLFFRDKIHANYNLEDYLYLSDYIKTLNITEFKKTCYLELLYNIAAYNVMDYSSYSCFKLTQMIKKERDKYAL